MNKLRVVASIIFSLIAFIAALLGEDTTDVLLLVLISVTYGVNA